MYIAKQNEQDMRESNLVIIRLCQPMQTDRSGWELCSPDFHFKLQKDCEISSNEKLQQNRCITKVVF